jgi:hypothetical protein
MTVSSTTVKNSYSGNGSTTQFAYGYKIFADSDLIVIIRVNSTGVETVKTLTTHYTVSGAGDASGGNVTFTSGNTPASGQTVVIIREVPQTQAIDYIANDPFPAESHEEGLDRGTMTTQQVQEELNRAIKLSRTNTMTSTEFTTSAADRANKVLAFNASGEIAVTQELGTFKGNSATTTTAAFVVRDIVKATTTAQLNNIYICVADSVIGDSLTDTDHFAVLVDAVAAGTSATAAASSASAASTSATAATNNGAAQVTLATAQVALATTQANNSATSATASASSATASGNSATASANSATAAAASADAFDDIYLGSKSSDPSTDNDGDALAAGMLYFNTSTDLLRVYTGSAWQNAAVDTTGFITLSGTQTLTNKTLTTPKIGTSILDTNGNELAKLTATGSAVNEFTVANAASGGNPTLSSTGGDSNIDLDLLAKGTGHVTIRGNTNQGTLQLNCENNTHGQQIKPQPHSVGSSAVHTLPDITGDLIAGKIEGTNFTDSLLVGHATTGTLDAATENTGVGIDTLIDLTSGDFNTAIGFGTLRLNTTGQKNTVIGSKAGYSMNNGQANTLIGREAGTALTSNAADNVAVGRLSLASAQNVGRNTAIGSFSGQNITGTRNVTVGTNAGDNITSGNGNVIIGGVDAASATGDRQLAIGTYDGSTTTTWISGDSSGNLVTPGTITANSVVLTGVAADNSITLAKMASGTDGNLITYDTSGNPAYVATGSAGQVLTSAGAGAVPTFADAGGGGGLTEADSWRLTADVTSDGDITSNLERDDTYGNGNLGTGMSVSSGIFTFPSTGYYLVTAFVRGEATGGDLDQRLDINVTTNNSSYNVAATCNWDGYEGPNAVISNSSTSKLLDVTNTSNVKVKFTASNFGGYTKALGSTSINYTHFNFLKVGDT